MVQFTIAYVALGFGLLLLLAGALSLRHASSAGMLSPNQRGILLGGIGGMLAFIAVAFLWLT